MDSSTSRLVAESSGCLFILWRSFQPRFLWLQGLSEGLRPGTREWRRSMVRLLFYWYMILRGGSTVDAGNDLNADWRAFLDHYSLGRSVRRWSVPTSTAQSYPTAGSYHLFLLHLDHRGDSLGLTTAEGGLPPRLQVSSSQG